MLFFKPKQQDLKNLYWYQCYQQYIDSMLTRPLPQHQSSTLPSEILLVKKMPSNFINCIALTLKMESNYGKLTTSSCPGKL